ncbi:hypothetical protein M378DRAFT_69902 [Amanita muscaria Koide BX008]|uniref:Protein kinase domain-containing protein n=1 Tax=Amanita muscaria (strain Koide BX008) TaxID=946122 RepID=A0A0C2XHX5_AMAMK|nr:hypothetical protein M378DRAFT_69902 [Amanita muscaria Koide BX008]
MTSNKLQFWGATLWDFYYIYRKPSLSCLITVSTASKLLTWMTDQGETHAIDEMASAANEEDPHEILPFPISEVIEAQEMNIRLGIYGISKPIDKDQRSDEAKGAFCPESYPAPWPLLPFSYEAAPLEHYIPLYQLPSTLVVHDPCDLLSVSKDAYGYSNKECDWASSEDRTYLYHQYVSTEGEERNKEEHKTKEEEKTRRRIKTLEDLHIDSDILPDNMDAMLLVPSSVRPGPSEPPILVLYEAAPDPKPAEIAHLYLSPEKIIGEGHHSLVANAEWEIPRSLIVPDILCYECILEDVHQTLLASDGADGSMKDEKWKAKSGVWQEHQVGRPAEVIKLKKMQLDSENPPPIQPTATYVLRSGNLETKYKYVGPFRPIKTNVKWQNGENYCSHISRRLHIDEGTRAHPLSAKVSVAAKLSMEGDHHLNNESNIYQTFPRHFFEHWNGYNVVAPFTTPTPVGAVVPQYYGYYKPPKDAPHKQYLSPIMLLEKCGRQVVVDDLHIDDRNECASLFHRLHREGYTHQSVFPRNVLSQDGPLDRPMYQRGTGDFTEDGRKHTFRLIDFGRTQKCKDSSLMSDEREYIEEMTKHTHYTTLDSLNL